MHEVNRRPLLIEVGSDDLPARFLPLERRHLAERLPALLDELGLAHGAVTVWATPRRLAARVEGVAERQPDREVTVKGPPVRIAFDDDGGPTRAAEGFARKNGVAVADCTRLELDGTEYLAVRQQEKGRSLAELLAEHLPPLLLGIPFPKTMRWGDGDLLYARPLQWLVVLHGSEVLPVRLGDLAADRLSRGHRTLADDAVFPVPDPDAYSGLLAEHGVMVDQEQRRDRIRDDLVAAAVAAGGRWREDAGLLDEVVDLCEHPTVFAGRIEERFFALPAEVIVTAMRSHQRYFAVTGDDGRLLPVFLAVRDGDTTALENVIRGNERVLRARLSDALFYWDVDRKRTPDDHTARLADVTWLEGFGSVLDKVRRVEALVRWLWERGAGGDGPLPAALARAAAICKFDLVTEMIRDGKEFTKLEGVIAARYAEQAGEDPAVCRLLEEYHRPRHAGDALPGDPAARVLALADRLDTLAGCWLAGFVPSGTKDPYALRRHMLAVQRMLLADDVRLDLDAALARAVEPFAGGPVSPEEAAAAAAALREFARARLEGLLQQEGLDQAVVRAVLPAHGADPADARRWGEALAAYREDPDFQLLATGFKRCRNILEGKTLSAAAARDCLDRWLAGGRTVEGEPLADLPEPAERELVAAVAAAAPDLAAAEREGDYQGIFHSLAALGPAIDRFFNAVRVNVDDPDLRRRRHGLLREIHGLFARFADLAQVAPLDQPPGK